MSSSHLESFLALIYTDEEARARFKANPTVEARRAGLLPEDCAALENMDWAGLELTSRSFAKKRQHMRRNANLRHLAEALRGLWLNLPRSRRLRFPPKTPGKSAC